MRHIRMNRRRRCQQTWCWQTGIANKMNADFASRSHASIAQLITTVSVQASTPTAAADAFEASTQPRSKKQYYDEQASKQQATTTARPTNTPINQRGAMKTTTAGRWLGGGGQYCTVLVTQLLQAKKPLCRSSVDAPAWLYHFNPRATRDTRAKTMVFRN